MTRLLNALKLQIDEPLVIECDNRQTIRLLVEEAAKLQTKLRHVDIHSHWLRQEVQKGTIQLTWQETKKMMADGLTKALNKAVFHRFIELLGLEDIKERLVLIRRCDELRAQLGEQENVAAFTHKRVAL
jgi:hypothetical protein